MPGIVSKSMFRTDVEAPSNLTVAWERGSDRSHFVIGPIGHPGVVRLPHCLGGELWHHGAETMWTNVTPERGLRPKWRVRRSVGAIPPEATITLSRRGFEVEVDEFATFPVHTLDRREGVLRSDAVDLMARVADVEIDEVSAAQLVLFRSILGPRSIIKGARRNVPEAPARPLGSRADAAEVGRTLVSSMRRIRRSELVATLSGGNDSRGIVLAAHAAAARDMSVVSVENGCGIREPEIAAIVAAALGRPLDVVRLPIDYCIEWMEPHAVACDYGWGGANPWGFAIAEYARQRPGAFLLDGLGGDYLLRNKRGEAITQLAVDMTNNTPDVGRRFVEIFLANRAESLGWALPREVLDAAVERAINDTDEAAAGYAGRQSSFGLVYLAIRAAPAIISQSLWWHDRSCFPYLDHDVWDAIERSPVVERFNGSEFQHAMLRSLDARDDSWPASDHPKESLVARGLTDDWVRSREEPRRLDALDAQVQSSPFGAWLPGGYEQYPPWKRVAALSNLVVGAIASRRFAEYRRIRREHLDSAVRAPTDSPRS